MFIHINRIFKYMCQKREGVCYLLHLPTQQNKKLIHNERIKNFQKALLKFSYHTNIIPVSRVHVQYCDEDDLKLSYHKSYV